MKSTYFQPEPQAKFSSVVLLTKKNKTRTNNRYLCYLSVMQTKCCTMTWAGITDFIFAKKPTLPLNGYRSSFPELKRLEGNAEYWHLASRLMEQ